MRICPNCDSLIEEDHYNCPSCQSFDFGWADHCKALTPSTRRQFHRKTIYADQLNKLPTSAPVEEYKIRLSAFSDSGELGFHLYRLSQLLENRKHQKVRVICNGTSWGYDWDYGEDYDPERDFYLPPSLPIPALVEVSRFIQVLLNLDYSNLELQLVLPPKTHAATKFINETGLFSTLSSSMITYASHALDQTFRQGCDNVLVPLTSVGPETDGQLLSAFHDNFNRLADAGYFEQEHRSQLRQVIMEAAENADIWGGGGWVCCFLRQEKRGSGRFGHQQDSFVPARETHLFLHVFSIGSSLADTVGIENEWEAAEIITAGYSARFSGGGQGMPSILNTVIQSTQGTVFISSKNYTRIITPDSLVREYISAGTDYLPGVHLCAVIPLAVISKIQSVRAVA